jgi:hypothetical protein
MQDKQHSVGAGLYNVLWLCCSRFAKVILISMHMKHSGTVCCCASTLLDCRRHTADMEGGTLLQCCDV